MQCKYFGQCGSCKLYEYSYDEQLNKKVLEIKDRFKELFAEESEIFPTTDGSFRNRVEFKIWHDKDESISFAMRKLDDPKGYVRIDGCSIANVHINEMMKKMVPLIQKNEILKNKLFGVDFLSSSDGEILISMLYHKKINEIWIHEAKKLKDLLGCDIIGRCKGKKFVLDKDYVTEKVEIDTKTYLFRHIENSFTQPNGDINRKIITFLSQNTAKSDHDLLELYCGMGNLTIPLAANFHNVLGIEISKSSIVAANINIEDNNIKNIQFVRMSSEEFTEAMDGKRNFSRLKDIDLDFFNFGTVLVDPPRSGLDKESLKLVKRFEKILYISCNPDTLKENLEELATSHEIKKMAFFDQFAYTPHLEMGVVLEKK